MLVKGTDRIREKRLYFFEEADPSNRKLLGGKGAGLAEMAQMGLPVPPGFIITTEVCKEYYRLGERLPEGLMEEVMEAMAKLEERTGKRFGQDERPLLVSVRSGAAISMPGMMDTVLNLGLNDRSVKGLMADTKDARFAYDTYRRFLQMFSRIVLGLDEKPFQELLERVKKEEGVESELQLSSEALQRVVEGFKRICRDAGRPFPQEPKEQLERAIEAVFRSWMGKRAVDYRREFKITPEMADGTAVSIVAMVFGNMGEDSGTGVVFTRDPSTGERRLYGDYLPNAQGEDVVAGVRTPKPIEELKREMPQLYRRLEELCYRLERHFKEPQDIEFTIEKGRLYLLQTRAAKMNPSALIKASVDMAKEGIIDRREAILRIKPEQLEQLLHPRIDPKSSPQPIARGIPASPGAAVGRAVFDADTAEEEGRKGKRVILVREETKPEDVHGFFSAQGILTSRGGKTSHAAVVARGMGKPCVCGCSSLVIDEEGRRARIGDIIIKEGDVIAIDGNTGHVYLGEVRTLEPELSDAVGELLEWADGLRRLGVRANADTPEAAMMARRFGAEGIGLCRTERMFNAADRLPLVVRMIMAKDKEEREEALRRLLPLQREDFKEILKVMDGLPVTIRLLDPPLHEFLPNVEQLALEVMELERKGIEGEELEEKRGLLEKARALYETNPMLGHRGVRVGISHPEIYKMQIKAICEATAQLVKEGFNPRPQIMVPQVGLAEEVKRVKATFEEVRASLEREYGLRLPIKFGTMIEVVRACLTAGDIAEQVEFFSFGTNDLTQGTFSFSREDVENKFLPLYLEEGVLKANPFEVIDEAGVGRLMRLAIEEGRARNGGLEIGICGEHGGDPESIDFCHRAGLDYVSASPYRIPVARLAAAQASLRRSGLG